MKPPSECVKCGGRMSPGFLIEYTHGSTLVSRWQAGEPKKSFWHGGIKPIKADQLPVTSYRCQRCGFLESYANPG